MKKLQEKRVKEEFKITGNEFHVLRRMYGDSTYDLAPVLGISAPSVLNLEKFKDNHIPFKYSIKLVNHWQLKKGKENEVEN